MKLFLNVNGDTIEKQVYAFKVLFNRAIDKLATRALLVYNSINNSIIDIYADSRAIMDYRGEAHLKLIDQAWRHIYGLLLPIIFSMLITLYLINVLQQELLMVELTSNVNDYTIYINNDQIYNKPSIFTSIEFYIVLGLLLITFIISKLYQRYRQFFQNIIKLLTIIDFFIIYFFLV